MARKCNVTRYEKTPHPVRHSIPRNRSGNVDGRKFAEVVRHDAHTIKENHLRHNNRRDSQLSRLNANEHRTITIPEEVNQEWLCRTLVGYTNGGKDLHWVSSQLEEKQICVERFLSWGDHKFLVIFKTEKTAMDTLRRCEEIWGDRVKDLGNWKKQDTRFTGECEWLFYEGVPLQCWSEQTFGSIGSLWDKVMEIDLGNDYDGAWIRVQAENTTLFHLQWRNIELVSGWNIFPIRATPLPFWIKKHIGWRLADQEIREEMMHKGGSFRMWSSKEKCNREREKNCTGLVTPKESPADDDDSNGRLTTVHLPRAAHALENQNTRSPRQSVQGLENTV